MAIRIILADNQAIFRNGVARIISERKEMTIAAQCSNLDELNQAMHRLKKCVVVFPSSFAILPDGLSELVGTLEFHGHHSIMILERRMTLEASISLKLGSVLPRSVDVAHLVEALLCVATGERYPYNLGETESSLAEQKRRTLVEGFTRREIKIVALISEGCKNKEIARRIGTGEQIVKNSLRSVYKKTGASDRLELALFTRQNVQLMKAIEALRSTSPSS